MMKYVYLTESGVPEDLSLPTVNADSIEHLAFLDLKAFKKLRKKIKTELKSDSQKIVIIYSTPATVIASGLRSQIEPEQLVTQWTQQAEALVELFKSYQSNCVLANSNALKADMSGLRKLVSMNKKERATFDILCKGADADIYTLSAHYMIDNNDDLKRQLLMLDACTTFNEYSEDTCDIQQILSQQTLKEEQFGEQLIQSQLALEQQQTEVGKLEQQIKTLSSQIKQDAEINNEINAKYALDVEQFQQVIKQLSQEKETAATQLQTLQRNVESQQVKIQNLDKENDTLNKALKSMQIDTAKQSEVNAQTINQLSQDKEALNKTLKNSQTDLANQTEENEQIIKQLHLVQEAFEESILSTNKLKSDTSVLEKQLERTENHQAWLVKELLASHEANTKSWSYRSLMKKKVALIKESGLFDEAWYLETYRDIAATKINPILHYLLYGAVEGKNPSAEFNTKNYLSIYFDVASHGMNPFIHYIKFGQAEGRKADPLQKRLPSPKVG